MGVIDRTYALTVRVSDEVCQEARRLYEEGLSRYDIAARLGVSPSTAGEYVKRAGGVLRARGKQRVRPRLELKHAPATDDLTPVELRDRLASLKVDVDAWAVEGHAE